jgi:prephenate dehydratase
VPESDAEVMVPPRYAYLGPAGTFTEQALLAHLAGAPADLVPEPSVEEALDAVRQGEVDAAMVPLENSIEGSVSATLDALAFGDPLVIVAEAQVPVSFALMAVRGTTLADVHIVTTHPHAQAQCRAWLSDHLPDAQVVLSSSTAGAAANLASGERVADAAIAAPLAAQVYDLEVLADGVGDHPDAETRFVLVGRPQAPQPATGADKTTLALFMGPDHPGALLEILTELAVRGINLTRIESRPTGGGLGDYYFCVDAEGHVDDARVGEALIGLRRVCRDVRYLGSYPRLDALRPQLRPGVTDAEFAGAQAWLARVREGRL